MDRSHFYSIMNGEGTLDYEIYLNTKALLSCQKDFKDFCNADELQFQVVHQVEEMWMKLIGYTLLDIDDYLQKENTNRVITLFRRAHIALRLMTEQLTLLERCPRRNIRRSVFSWATAAARSLRVSAACSRCIRTSGTPSSRTISRSKPDDRTNLQLQLFTFGRLRGGRGPGGI